MPLARVKVGLACVVLIAVDKLTNALVVIMLLGSIFVALEVTSANAELDGVLSIAEKLIDVDGDVIVVVAVNAKVLLLDILVLKFNELLGVVVGLPKLKVVVVGVVEDILGVEDIIFCKDSVFAITGVIDTTFA